MNRDGRGGDDAQGGRGTGDRTGGIRANHLIGQGRIGRNIAERQGGNTSEDNLKPICAQCNRSMGTKSIEEFRAILSVVPNEIENDISIQLQQLIIADTPCVIPDSICQLWSKITETKSEVQWAFLEYETLLDRVSGLDVLESIKNPGLYERLRYIYFSLFYWDLLPRFFCFQSHSISIELYKLHIRSMCLKLIDNDANFSTHLIKYLRKNAIFVDTISHNDLIERIITRVNRYSEYRNVYNKILI